MLGFVLRTWVLAGVLVPALSLMTELRAQTYQQTVRGTVTDADTGLPLTGATVMLKPVGQGAVTDSLGRYRLGQIAPGRYTLSINYLGYETLETPEILVSTGKETVAAAALKTAGAELATVTVRAPRPEVRAMACPTVYTLSIEETLRFPATFYDPARLALLLPGVVQANDQNNGMSVRGHSPIAVSWRLEGIEVANLNHTANAGTLSDGVAAVGGGVNALSAQLLDNAQFYNGVFPLAYGNAIGGVMDMRLRAGNNERREYTFQAGLIGIDLAAEGPFRKGGRSSYLVNYRYSFTGLLSDLGVPLGDETIKFQDLSFNLVFPGRKGGRFAVHGVFGFSSNLYNGSLPADSTLWESEKQAYGQIKFEGSLGLLGATYQRPVGRKGALSASMGYSVSSSVRKASFDLPSFNFESRLEQDENINGRVNFNTSYRHRFRPGQVGEIGIELLGAADQSTVDRRDRNSPGFSFAKYITEPYFGALYGRWRWEKGQWQASLGGRATVVQLMPTRGNEELRWFFAPRGYLTWSPTSARQWQLSYGVHQQFSVLEASAQHLVLGYRLQLSPALTARLEAYVQQVDALPGSTKIRFINGQEAADIPSLPLADRARHAGLEGSLQRFAGEGWYYLLTAAVYQAEYRADEEAEWRETRFSGRFASSLVLGREWSGEPADQQRRRLGVNVALQLNGGQRVAPIDVAVSNGFNFTVFDTARGYPEQLPAYFRTDLRVYFQRNRTNWSSTLSLDVQNATNYQNVAFRYYDRLLQRETERRQLSTIPVISYRINW